MHKNQASSPAKCITKYCRKDRAKRSSYCSACEYKNKKKNNPLQLAYSILKYNARRRGKIFTISFEYFCKFAIKVKYLKKKGTAAYAYHIDRINEELGYVEGNLQLLTNAKNVKKYIDWRVNEKGKPVDFYTHTKKKTDHPDKDMPF